MEINDQSQRNIKQFHVAEQLRFIDRMNSFDGFHPPQQTSICRTESLLLCCLRCLLFDQRPPSRFHLIGLESYFLRLHRTENAWLASFKVNSEDEWREVAEVVDGEKIRTLISNSRVGLYARSPMDSINAVVDQFEIVVPGEPVTYGPRD